MTGQGLSRPQRSTHPKPCCTHRHLQLLISTFPRAKTNLSTYCDQTAHPEGHSAWFSVCITNISTPALTINHGATRQNIRLDAIYTVKSLIQEQTHSATSIHPRWTILIQRRVIPQHSKEVDHDEKEPRQSNLKAEPQVRQVDPPTKPDEQSGNLQH